MRVFTCVVLAAVFFCLVHGNSAALKKKEVKPNHPAPVNDVTKQKKEASKKEKPIVKKAADQPAKVKQVANEKRNEVSAPEDEDQTWGPDKRGHYSRKRRYFVRRRYSRRRIFYSRRRQYTRRRRQYTRRRRQYTRRRRYTRRRQYTRRRRQYSSRRRRYNGEGNGGYGKRNVAPDDDQVEDVALLDDISTLDDEPDEIDNDSDVEDEPEDMPDADAVEADDPEQDPDDDSEESDDVPNNDAKKR